MTIRQHSDQGRRLAAQVLSVAGVLAAALLAAVPAQADVSPTKEPGVTIAIGADASSIDRSVFQLDGVLPGDHYSFPVYLRNDSRLDAEVSFNGFTYSATGQVPDGLADDLRSQTTVTLEHNGVVLGRANGDSWTSPDARVSVPAGTTQALRSELVMPATVGNSAQGKTLDVKYHFSVTLARETPDGKNTPAERDPSAHDSSEALPRTGEALTVFHALVWAALGVFAALLGALFLAALRRPAPSDPEAEPLDDELLGSSR